MRVATREKIFANRYEPVDFSELYVSACVEGMFLEVGVLEEWVHVEARRPEVVCTGHVRHHALTTATDLRQTHPHVPVPHLTGHRGNYEQA